MCDSEAVEVGSGLGECEVDGESLEGSEPCDPEVLPGPYPEDLGTPDAGVASSTSSASVGDMGAASDSRPLEEGGHEDAPEAV